MKKLLIIAMVLVAAPVMAQQMYVTPQVEFAYGISEDVYDPGGDITVNPGIGAGITFGYGVMPNMAVEANVGFLYWIADTPSSIDDYTLYYIPFSVGVNYHINPMIGIIGGVGMNYSYTEVEISGFGSSDDSYTEFSFYVGAEFDINNIIIRPKFVYTTVDEEDAHYIGVAAGYKINL